MGDDQAGDLLALERAVEQRRPGRDRLVVADAGIDHRPAVAIGEQVDVHMVEAERQIQPDPQHARHDLDDLVVAGMGFPGIAQGLGRVLDDVGLWCAWLLPLLATGASRSGRPRQPKEASRCTRARLIRVRCRASPRIDCVTCYAARILVRKVSISSRSTSASRRSASEASSTSVAAVPASSEAC